jgi:general secretion pathway protein L
MSMLRLFRSWLDQFMAKVGHMLPNTDVREIVENRTSAVLSVGADKVTAARWTERTSSQHPRLDQKIRMLGAKDQIQASDKVVIVFGHDTMFSHTLHVPNLSLANARKILELELSRLMPFADSSLLRFQWLSEDGNTANQAVVKQSSVDAALTALKNSRAKIEALGVLQSDGSLAPAFLTLTGKDYAAVGEKPWKHATVLATSAFLLANLGMCSHISGQSRKAEKALVENITQLTLTAKGVRLDVDLIESKKKLTSSINALRLQNPSVTSVWQELTSLLPDKSWIQQLSYNGELFQIEGVSTDAAKLVPILEESKLFKDVAFSAAVTQSIATDTQRFSIRFRTEVVQ